MKKFWKKFVKGFNYGMKLLAESNYHYCIYNMGKYDRLFMPPLWR